MMNHEMCGKVQAQTDSLKNLNGDSVAIEQGSIEYCIEAIQPTPPEMEDVRWATIDELRGINLGTTDDPKPIFVSTMLNDEVV